MAPLESKTGTEETSVNPESRLLQTIRLTLSRGDARLFRFQSGNFELADGRRIVSGFIGAGDLIGWRTLLITPEMVGQRIAQFASVEVKTARGRVTAEQQAWLRAVQAAGGVGGVVRSVEEAVELLR